MITLLSLRGGPKTIFMDMVNADEFVDSCGLAQHLEGWLWPVRLSSFGHVSVMVLAMTASLQRRQNHLNV